jgi:lipoprotein-anchoring transpeptidase ErfK/SrfK
MGNDNITNDGSEHKIEKSSSDADTVNKENVPGQNVSSEERKNVKNPFLSLLIFVIIIVGSILVIIALSWFIVYAVPGLKELSPTAKTKIVNDQELTKSAAYKKLITSMNKDIQRLSLKYNGYTSGQSYIVINTTDNRFSLFTNKNLIREGSCSTGSYIMLQASSGNKKWVFKTPRGKYWIHGKKTNPVWKRPDWSFVEEGSKIPSANDDSRYEYGVLGDYALTLGDGYMIHGTIYKRFLGMPVTHGCVRLNDEDLKVVYNTLNIGSKVYIF